MDYQKELEEMRARYADKPLFLKTLPCPEWLTPKDRLYSIYKEHTTLCTHGKIYYGCIVQANEILFRYFPQTDHPGNLIYTTDPLAERNPWVLRQFASTLFYYKDKPEQDTPQELREIVAVIRDEMDRSSFSFRASSGDSPAMDMTFLALMIFRKHLPKRTLKGSIVPIIAAPEYCKSVMILPKKYWTKALIEDWGK